MAKCQPWLGFANLDLGDSRSKMSTAQQGRGVETSDNLHLKDHTLDYISMDTTYKFSE